MRTANCHLRIGGENHGELRKTKVSFDRIMMQATCLKALVGRSVGWSVSRLNLFKDDVTCCQVASYVCDVFGIISIVSGHKKVQIF